MDLTQLLLTVIIVVLTVLLVVLGIQAFLVLMEFRKTMNKTNKILDDVKSGTNVAKILGTVAALFLGKNLGKGFVNLMATKEKPQKLEEKGNVELKVEVKKPVKNIRRFFRRSS